MSADIGPIVQAVVVGASFTAAVCGAALWVGGAVARMITGHEPDFGDRATGCIAVAGSACAVALALFLAYGIGTVILDALQ